MSATYPLGFSYFTPFKQYWYGKHGADQCRVFRYREITMANEQNLKPQNTRTKAEQREIARQGGIASGKARRENKLIKDRILERMGETDWDTMIDNLISRAMETDKAFEILRDTVGQKPTEKVDLSVNDESAKEIDDYFTSRYNRPADE